MKRHTKLERAKLLEKYSKHVGSRKSFCESEGVTIGTLQYWLKQSGRAEASGNFIEVVSPPVKESEYLEITTRSGTTIRIPL